MSLKRFLNRRKANAQKKAQEKQDRLEKATNGNTTTMEVPADNLPEIAEAHELVVKRRQLLLKEQEALLKQLDFLGVALQEQTNAVCMAAGIDPTGKIVNWGPEGNFIILTKAPAAEQSPAPPENTEEQAPAATLEPATDTQESASAPEETAKDESPEADLKKQLAELEESFKSE